MKLRVTLVSTSPYALHRACRQNVEQILCVCASVVMDVKCVLLTQVWPWPVPPHTEGLLPSFSAGRDTGGKLTIKQQWWLQMQGHCWQHEMVIFWHHFTLLNFQWQWVTLSKMKSLAWKGFYMMQYTIWLEILVGRIFGGLLYQWHWVDFTLAVR